jgi:hypothetical protein
MNMDGSDHETKLLASSIGRLARRINPQQAAGGHGREAGAVSTDGVELL